MDTLAKVGKGGNELVNIVDIMEIKMRPQGKEGKTTAAIMTIAAGALKCLWN
jgi:hypothetical protein